MKIKEFIPEQEQKLIVKAIGEAELHTSGEIRVHLESKCSGDPIARAVYIFKYIKMYKTALRNGVLIYIAVDSHKFAIIGDVGIHSKVPADYWDNIKSRMGDAFSAGRYTEGICTAIHSVGLSLKEFFPYKNDDINEQSNEISFGE